MREGDTNLCAIYIWNNMNLQNQIFLIGYYCFWNPEFVCQVSIFFFACLKNGAWRVYMSKTHLGSYWHENRTGIFFGSKCLWWNSSLWFHSKRLTQKHDRISTSFLRLASQAQKQKHHIHSPKTNSWNPWKNGGWESILSFWVWA